MRDDCTTWVGSAGSSDGQLAPQPATASSNAYDLLLDMAHGWLSSAFGHGLRLSSVPVVRTVYSPLTAPVTVA